MMPTIPNLPKDFAGDVYDIMFILSYTFSKHEKRFETRLHSGVTNKAQSFVFTYFYPLAKSLKITRNMTCVDTCIHINQF